MVERFASRWDGSVLGGFSGRSDRLFWLALVQALFLAASALAADEDDELPEYGAGLVATYTQGSAEPVRRIDDDVQFVWNGAAPDPRLGDGPFQAQWRGRLFVMSPGSYRLQLYVAGKAELRLNGRSLLKVDAATPAWHESEMFQSSYGHHPLEIDYVRTSDAATLKLYWSGPQFGVEPVPERHLFHDPAQKLQTQFAEGAQWVRALRCAACHDLPSDSQPLPAPALTHLTGNLDRAWMVRHLTAPTTADADNAVPTRRRMPHFDLSPVDAEAVTAYLFAQSQKSAAVKVPEAEAPPPAPPSTSGDSKKKPKPRTKPSVTIGRQLTHTLGCLACHRIGDLGTDGAFAGTELTHSAAKRTPEFFVRWLNDAQSVNSDHRMPQFKLGELEAADVAAYLATLGRRSAASNDAAEEATETQFERGRKLVAEHRCAACHRLPGVAEKPARITASIVPRGGNSHCLGEPDGMKKRPGYRLPGSARAAVEEFLRSAAATKPTRSAADEGRFVLAERNCLACHSRGLRPGLVERVPAVTAALPELASVQASLLPPSLNGVGDKLTDASLVAAVKTDRAPLRPWLKVRMPKFHLSDVEMAALQAYLVDHDRIPDRPLPLSAQSDETAQRLAARRLVTADGFGCTSCHKIGAAEPSGTIAIAAMGTDLTMIGDRLRKPWFDRWVRNPARIIPRMEMPAVQLPVRGVLHDDVNEQLAAVWKVLNEPGFTPPKPNPVRIVRSRNVPGLKEPPHVLTDVFIVDGETYVSPIVIGLPNRHNVLFDLERNRLAAWWTGDTALERTKGKSWYWEPGGAMVRKPKSASDAATDLGLVFGEPTVAEIAVRSGQNNVELDSIASMSTGVEIFSRQIFADAQDAKRGVVVRIRQFFEMLPPNSNTSATSGFRRTVEVEGLGPGGLIVLTDRAPSNEPGTPRVVDQTLGVGVVRGVTSEFCSVAAKRGNTEIQRLVLDYVVDLPLDTFPNEPPTLPSPPPQKLDVVPGYEAVRLPLTGGEMPTGLAWSVDGSLLVSSLKGRVMIARDTNGDGLEDVMTALSDDLATPYGLAVANDVDREVIDVITKTALVRLHDDDRDGFYERQEMAADGWGHTDDYHDWAVGLPKIHDRDGGFAGYYVALPCQQDERSEAEARFRGQALKLIPREPTPDDPRRFRVEPFCGGLRFPMGVAVDRRGRLFATDNQGHYNPFNELNHLQPGKRFGYINKLERKPDFNPPTESPAVEIPHPWTRSVNGICFLDTPASLRAQLGRDHFGPFEGHLLGCEFNERVLVRMSLEEIDGVMQGAIYPFTRRAETGAPTFEGPNVTAVAPDGDIYVGSLLDSGWGGGQNTGSLFRLVPQQKLPTGIAEVRAAADGFIIRFTAAMDREKLATTKNFTVERYRRESTPQYGGDDRDRSAVKVQAAEPSEDGLEVRLRCDKLQAGFVYEFYLQNLTGDGETLFPAEAHYTMKRLPSDKAK